jgi:hypothetical protein
MASELNRKVLITWASPYGVSSRTTAAACSARGAVESLSARWPPEFWSTASLT